MKHFFLSAIGTVLLFITSCSQPITPASYNYGYKSIRQFFERNFNIELFRNDVLENSEKYHRVLVSFVVTKEGAADSIIVHEKTSDKLASEVLRVIKLSSGHWSPYKINGNAKTSPRIFWPVYLICADCSPLSAEEMTKQNKKYFKEYPYTGLVGWESQSVVQEAIGFIVFPTMR